MWPAPNLTSLLRIDVPIVQAPMIVQQSLVPLASAVCNAGGLGSLGCGEMSTAELEQAISEMRLATQGPFNLNFFLHQPPKFDPDIDATARSLVEPFYEQLNLEVPSSGEIDGLRRFDNETLMLLVQQRPAMVSFHFGCPTSRVTDALRAAGIVVDATATTVEEALELERSGVDLVVAQGWEAGGHRGSFQLTFEDTGVGTMALVPQVVDAVRTPVIAAGGIADGRGIVAAHCLGAVGVWMGTPFLSCTETPITPVHRTALLSATDQDTHLSRAFSGRSCRARRTPYSDRMAIDRSSLPDFPLMYNYSSPLKRSGIANNDLDFQFLLYGQGASLNREMTAQGLIEKLSAEVSDTIVQLGG